MGGWTTSKQASKQLRLVLRILYIEDERDVREAIAGHLRLRGIEVVEAANLDEALAVPLDSIDAILADVWIRHRRIHEIVPELFTREPKMPIVALSGNAAGSDGFELKELGVYAFLAKGVSTDEIIETLEAAARSVAGGEGARFVELKKMRSVQLERLLRDALALTQDNVSEAARLLGYTRAGLEYWIDKLRMASERREPRRRTSAVRLRAASPRRAGAPPPSRQPIRRGS